MNFSKITDYALRILSHIAKDSEKVYWANDFCCKLDIPFRYLRKLLTILSKVDLLYNPQEKVRGYQLSRNPNSIQFIYIVKATGDDIIEQKCFFGYQQCPLNNPCGMYYKWKKISKGLISTLESTNS